MTIAFEAPRFYLDDIAVKKLFVELAELRTRLAEAKSNLAHCYTREEIASALGVRPVPSKEELQNETFTDRSRVCNWRNYVHQHKWAKMTDLQRLLAYTRGVELAGMEEWD